jgi:Mce-associated membrane protein
VTVKRGKLTVAVGADRPRPYKRPKPSDDAESGSSIVEDVVPSAVVGSADLADGDDADVAETAANDAAEPVMSARRRSAVIGFLVGGILVSLCLAAWFGLSAYQVRNAESSANAALVDVAASNAVEDQVSRAIRTAFSYDYTNIARAQRAAKDVLIGKAVEQYNALLDRAAQQAIAEKMVLTTAVRAVGIMELKDNHARLLVFVDRQIIRASDKHDSASGQLIVVAERIDGVWKISDIQVL